MPTGIENLYIQKYNKRLRLGFTTGTCAAAAAKGAASMLLKREKTKEVMIITPKGIALVLPLVDVILEKEYASCGVIKDAGDDPDVTDGLFIGVNVCKSTDPHITITGGKGVGTITQKGMDQPVGEAAINRVPREMIENAVLEVCHELGYEGGIEVEVFVPQGEEITKKTFNSRLGIKGGISILGTSGIVEPMSNAALIETIRTEIKMKEANDQKIILVTPGNYGQAFSADRLDLGKSIKCSNFVGETVDACVEFGMEKVLFVAHLGKFIKVAGGIMNTHSKEADCRAELLAAHALLAGGSAELARKILATLVTEEGIPIVKEAGLLDQVMASVLKKITFYLNQRSGNALEVGVILFSNQWGRLGETGNAEMMINELKDRR